MMVTATTTTLTMTTSMTKTMMMKMMMNMTTMMMMNMTPMMMMKMTAALAQLWSSSLHWLGTLHMVGLGLTGGRAQATSFTTGLSAKAASAVQKGHTAQCPFETLVEFQSFCVPPDL